MKEKKSNTDWHHLSVDMIERLIETDLKNGLSLTEVDRRQKQFGPNLVTSKKGIGSFMRFLLQFHQPLVYILLAAGLITMLIGEWVDSGVIFAVVVINAIIGFIQETKAEKAIDALKKMVTTESTVIRGGKRDQVSSVDLVLGDLVVLTSGDKVPADLRLCRERDLQIDESALTGESVAVAKEIEELTVDTSLADRVNMAYAGTLVTYGQGQGVVVAIGDETETGRISQLISEAVTLATPLTRKIAKFSHLLLWVILGLAAASFLIGIARGEDVRNMFMAAVALAVGAIPEGLPAAVTITLAIGVNRMARRKGIVRKLPAVETLGSTTVICSDKTGTLTENQMTVQKVSAGGELYDVTGGGYSPEGEIIGAPCTQAMIECLKAGVLCNDAQLVEDHHRWTVQGDPTEGALITAGAKADLSHEKLNREYARLDIIPFESQHKYMATLHECPQGDRRIVYMKGAVERVLERCANVMTDEGGEGPLDADQVLRQTEDLSKMGLRVLGFARCVVGADKDKVSHEDVSENMTFLGLQGMIDPPRHEAGIAIRACRAAGIAVKMITGDHALTASSIGHQLRLADDEMPSTITGKELAEMSDEEMRDIVERTVIFARTAPEQKLRLVEALQARGNVVAMTGDGVNDAPALKRADIGIAMGITGTEVSKEAADIILTDDNFATIEAAVEEGRGVFDNLTKFITWTLPTNMGEGLVILASIIAGTAVALPILPVQILWINMTTAVLLGLSLAFEPKEAEIMVRPPRQPDSPILTPELIRRVVLVGLIMLAGAFGLFLWYKRTGAELAVARTIAVNVFVVIEIFYLFRCRSLTKTIWEIGFFTNPWAILGVAIMVVLQLIYTYVPVMNRLFSSAPIGLVDWLIIIAVAWVGYVIVGIEMAFYRRRNRKITGSVPQ